jgi:hypothetical protein
MYRIGYTIRLKRRKYQRIISQTPHVWVLILENHRAPRPEGGGQSRQLERPKERKPSGSEPGGHGSRPDILIRAAVYMPASAPK